MTSIADVEDKAWIVNLLLVPSAFCADVTGILVCSVTTRQPHGEKDAKKSCLPARLLKEGSYVQQDADAFQNFITHLKTPFCSRIEMQTL